MTRLQVLTLSKCHENEAAVGKIILKYCFRPGGMYINAQMRTRTNFIARYESDTVGSAVFALFPIN